MADRSPQAIFDLYGHIQVDGKKMRGIAEPTHKGGYHRSRNWIVRSGRDRRNDPSVVLEPDRGGEGDCASALDVELPSGQMVAVFARLLKAAQDGDTRLAPLREFAGSPDGVDVAGYDLSTWSATLGWHESHRTVLHLGIYRQYADDSAALAGIADVINGGIQLPRPVAIDDGE